MKTIWIVNEYNLPGVPRTRQTILSQRLRERGYAVYLICGSTVHKTGCNCLTGAEQYCRKGTNEKSLHCVSPFRFLPT